LKVIKEIFPDLTDEEIKDAYKIELVCEVSNIPTLTIYKHVLGTRTNTKGALKKIHHKLIGEDSVKSDRTLIEISEDIIIMLFIEMPLTVVKIVWYFIKVGLRKGRRH